MKFYLIAGEKSGDLHAANLMEAIKQQLPNSSFRGLGGDNMQGSGMHLVRHFRDMAFMGFWEVFKNLRTIRKYLTQCQQDILSYQPDVLILVDYGGFNMRIASFARKKGLKIVYYIPPKIWAWNQKRALKIKRDVDLVLTILPFEQAFFASFDIPATYVGNPVKDAIKKYVPNPSFLVENHLSAKPVIAVLPGSRYQEITTALPTILKIVKHFPEYQFVIAGVNSVIGTVYEPAMAHGVRIVFEQTYDLLAHAKAAIVTSGTATLETALFNVPQVVCYRTSAITYHIAKHLIRVKYISLVNLIADTSVVEELIQHDFNPKRLREVLAGLLGEKRQKMLEDYQGLNALLSADEASKVASEKIINFLAIDNQ